MRLWQVVTSLWVFCCAAGLFGCASGPVMIDGRPVARKELVYTGQPYRVRYTGAHPLAEQAPPDLRGDGGWIGGAVCGVDVQYGVEHRGDHVQLVGTLDNQLTSQIRVGAGGGVLSIVGSIGRRGVDLRVGRDGIVGGVGRRRFQLLLEGEQLVERFRVAQRPGVLVTLKLNGLDALLQMAPAAQGAVVPLMLACLMENFEDGLVNDQAEFGFGGPAGAMPTRRVSLEGGGGAR